MWKSQLTQDLGDLGPCEERIKQ